MLLLSEIKLVYATKEEKKWEIVFDEANNQHGKNVTLNSTVLAIIHLTARKPHV